MNHKIIPVTPENLNDHPQFICFINPKHPAYPFKVEWFQKRYQEGLRINLLYPADENKAAAFIEFVPGEKAWRPVIAPEYLFIHCIWVSPDKNKHKGYGSMIIQYCSIIARMMGKKGVAVITSNDSFMAEKELFVKNGFSVVESTKEYELLALMFKDGQPPTMNNHHAELAKYIGLHIVYSAQCPWVARFVEEVRQTPAYQHLNITFTELKTPEEAQFAPSFYGTFSLIYKGKLFVAHYISTTRFNNILKKERLI